MNIQIPHKKIVMILSLAAILLITLSALGQVYRYAANDGTSTFVTWLFNLDGEHNVPTFFSVILLLICSLLLVAIGELKRNSEVKYNWHWTALGIIFFGLATDETILIHERTIKPIRNVLHTGGFFHYAWVIPAGIFLFVLFLFYRRFLADLPTKFRRLFILAGSIYVAGAVGLEMIEGLIDSRQGINNVIYATLINIEETLEIFGVIIFMHALFAYIEYLGGDFTIRIKGK